jgi:DNA-binding transcriptional ArsR family regulator
MSHAIQLIDNADDATVALHPLRRRILEHLQRPDSAAGVARALELPRQRITYHVRELERAGLVEPVEERRRGNCVERVVRATARAYVIAPQALGGVGAGSDPSDRFSSAYVVGVAGQTLRDMAELRRSADAEGSKLQTLSLQTEVRFASPAAQHGFAEELAQVIGALAAKYHDEHVGGGRTFRFNLVGYPRPAEPAGTGETQGVES